MQQQLLLVIIVIGIKCLVHIALYTASDLCEAAVTPTLLVSVHVIRGGAEKKKCHKYGVNAP